MVKAVPGSGGAQPPAFDGHPRRAILTLLGFGVVGPVLFTLSYAINEALRSGFNLWQESISMLSRGPAGWIQSASFTVFGLMSMAFAVGLARLDPPPDGSPWIARLQAGIGVALVFAGLVVQHRLNLGPGGVRPAGLLTPYGYITVAGFVHVLAAVLIYASTVGSCLLVGRSLRQRTQIAAAAYSTASGWLYALCIVGFALAPLLGGPAGLFERLASLIGAVWTVWFASRTLSAVRSSARARSQTAAAEP
ncbi:MAG: DUF998 domain-containing protein [Sulfobacillus sp.]